MKFDKKIFAKAIKYYREEKKLSLRAAQKKSGISAATISRIENGMMPEMKTYVVLCNFMGENPSYYFS